MSRNSEQLEKLIQERTERLEYVSRQLSALNEVSHRFSQIHDENEFWDEVPNLLTRSLDFDRGNVILMGENGLYLRSYSFAKDSPEFVQNFLTRLRSKDLKVPEAITECLKQNKTIFIPDLNTDPRWPKEPGEVIRTKAVVMTTIRVNNAPIGLLFANMQHHVRAMDSGDVTRFEMFASMAGQALVNIRAYQSLETKVMERTADLAQTNGVLRETQTQLVQSEKMASLGMLVAGIAHEINTPVAAIYSMHDTLVKGLAKLRKYLREPADPQEEQQINTATEIIEEANRVIETGCERVTNILKRLRSFARLDEAELKKVDILEGLEDTLALVNHELKHRIRVIKEFDKLPAIACFPGRLNQVFLNMLVNAKQAIQGNGEIRIKTYFRDGNVHISIKDSGAGILREHLPKLFDPGFTTKGVGVGTGLGLSICYQIIQDHKGRIQVESEPGKGSEFTIILPANLETILSHETRVQSRES